MNALLNAGQTENLVYLHLSEGNSIGRINEATLSLYVNDKKIESASKYSVSPPAYNPEITFAWKPQRKAESIMSVRK